MAALREFSKITIYFAGDGGNPGVMVPSVIEAEMTVKAKESGLVVTGKRRYTQEYSTLTAGVKAKVDSFVSDVGASVNARDPITGQ